jgi:hypothetical protein
MVALRAAVAVVGARTPLFAKVDRVLAAAVPRDDGDHARVVAGRDRRAVGVEGRRDALEGPTRSWFKFDAFRFGGFVVVHGFELKRTRLACSYHAGVSYAPKGPALLILAYVGNKLKLFGEVSKTAFSCVLTHVGKTFLPT